MTKKEMKKINNILVKGCVDDVDYPLYKKYMEELIQKAQEKFDKTEEEKRHLEEMISKITPSLFKPDWDLINPAWDVKVSKKENK